MKIHPGKATVTIKARSLTVAEARDAARTVKLERSIAASHRSGSPADSFRERYLGHFGGTIKKSGSKRAKASLKKHGSRRSGNHKA